MKEKTKAVNTQAECPTLSGWTPDFLLLLQRIGVLRYSIMKSLNSSIIFMTAMQDVLYAMPSITIIIAYTFEQTHNHMY